MICRAWFRSDQSFLDPNTNIFPPQPQGLFLRRCNPIVSIFLRSAGQQADITRHRVSFEVSGLGSTGLPEIPASGPRVFTPIDTSRIIRKKAILTIGIANQSDLDQPPSANRMCANATSCCMEIGGISALAHSVTRLLLSCKLRRAVRL